jgi:hypothetical protein
MRIVYAISLILILVPAHSTAHEDTPLSVSEDGTIVGVPDEFGKIRINTRFSKNRLTSLQLQIGMHVAALPDCLLRRVRSARADDLYISGSWHNDVDRLQVPPYLNILMFDSPHSRAPGEITPYYSVIFNLNNAQLLEAGRHRKGLFGLFSGYRPIDIKQLCS